MILGERRICDRCGASIGIDAVSLQVTQAGIKTEEDRRPRCNGWIAHYHPECFDEIDDRIVSAADPMAYPVADSIEALNAIPVAEGHAIARTRQQHRLPDGSRPEWRVRSPREVRRDRASSTWRTLSEADRDAAVLEAIGDGPSTLREIWPVMVLKGTAPTEGALRSYLKSMVERGLLDEDVTTNGRRRLVWSVRNEARVTS